jgi:hypothetical protein
MKPTPYSELDRILDDFEPARLEDGQMNKTEAKQAILALIEQQKLEARIDEVEKAVSNFRWGQGTDDLTDRLAELKQKGK